MGREVRRVAANWQHPKNESGQFIPLFNGAGYNDAVREWDAGNDAWSRGVFPNYASEDSKKLTYSEWDGERPIKEDYMPVWAEEELTHIMMYEDTSEGTPISPAFETPEELAKWCADNNASAFGGMTADYEHWLRVARGGWAPSLVINECGVRSGVEAI